MSKPRLSDPYHSLEKDIITVLQAGLKEYRSDLEFPESYSDMQACVRNLLRLFDVERKNTPFDLPYDN